MNSTGVSTKQYDAAFERKAWLRVGFTWFAYCLNYSDRQVIFSIFPILKSELKFTDAQLGLTGSVFLWVYGLCSPIAGQIGDRFSKRWLVAMSLLLWSGVTALTGAAHTAGMIFTCRALTGVTESLFVPAAVALLANAHRPENRSRAFALYGTGQLAGIVVGGWYGGFMAQEFQWRFAFYSLGLIGILYCYPYFRFLKGFSEEAHVETRKSGSPLAVTALARIPTYLVLCVVSGVFNLTLWLLYAWLPDFLLEKFSLGLADAGFTATVYLQRRFFISTPRHVVETASTAAQCATNHSGRLAAVSNSFRLRSAGRTLATAPCCSGRAFTSSEIAFQTLPIFSMRRSTPVSMLTVRPETPASSRAF